MNYVKFLRGTTTNFENITNKDRNTLYFVSDSNSTTGSLYLGDVLIAGKTDISNSKLNELNNVSIDLDNLNDGDILVFDYASQKWTSKSLSTSISSVMTGATITTAGKAGLVPAPEAGDNELFLRGDGTWAIPVITTKTTEYKKDGPINVTVTNDNDSTIVTYAHSNIETKTIDVTPEEQSNIITVVTSATTDTYGHITEIKTQDISIPVSVDGGSKISNVEIVTEEIDAGAKINVIVSGSQGESKTDSFALTSETLNIARSDDSISANLVWGSFD